MAKQTTTWPNAGARLDRLPSSGFHWGVYWMVAFGLLTCWSNAIGGLVLAVLTDIGWADNSSAATFSSLTTAGMFLGALLGGIIGDRVGRRKGFMMFVIFHVITMVVAAFSPNMTFLIIVRFVMGFALGGLLPSSSRHGLSMYRHVIAVRGPHESRLLAIGPTRSAHLSHRSSWVS